MAAKFVHGKDKYSNTSECMVYLHWLMIRQRFDHKVLTIVYHCLNNEAHEYLKDLLTLLPGGREGLRSAAQYQSLLVPFVKCKTFAERSFSVRGSKTVECTAKLYKASS